MKTETVKKAAPFGSWASPVTPALISRGTVRFRELTWDGDDLYWVESRPSDGGRQVIVKHAPGKPPSDVIEAPWNSRTRVHEYGGGSFIAFRGEVYFSHFPDQRVYRASQGKAPVAITPERPWRYADFEMDTHRSRLVSVAEDHTGSAPSPHEPRNFLVSLDTQAGGEPLILAQGRDFYACPRLSPDGTQLAWLSWDHPNMPWDRSELWVAPVEKNGLGKALRVAGGAEESLFQPSWSPDGRLHFVSDRTGWWNLYRWQNGNAVALCPMEAEFGLPQWNFGSSTYCFNPSGEILCSYLQNGFGQLARLRKLGGPLESVPSPFTEFSLLKSGAHDAAFVGGSPTESPRIVRFSHSTGSFETVRLSRESSIDPETISKPQAISFPSLDQEIAHAFFYPPKNKDFTGTPSEKPPLVVISHGGPTSAASPTLDSSIQYWTSRGFGVLDVNYGGSTGYGRKYRSRLREKWGIVDVEDCIRGAKYLAAQGSADEKRLVIRGGSAGGYTTLCALTFHSVFRAGASYYGVSDLVALLRDTHKFESRYDNFLIGSYEKNPEAYRERSPIHFTDKLNCPLILFQGLEDKVVPPNQSEMLFEAARKKGLPVAYLAFAGEQHGFRKAENIERCLGAELYFYSRIFGFTPTERIEPVVIENMTS